MSGLGAPSGTPASGHRRISPLLGRALVSVGAVVLLVSSACSTAERDRGEAVPATSGWTDLLLPDDTSTRGAAPVLAVLAITDWRDQPLVVTTEGDLLSAWAMQDGGGWKRREFAPPSRCSSHGGVVATSAHVVVSCHGDDGLVSVAATDDLVDWDRHTVGAAGPSFGTTIGPGPAGGLTVTALEARDVNTTEGSRLRVWTGADLDTWTEVQAADDVLLDVAPQRIRVFAGNVIITGAITDYSNPSGARWRPAIWVSRRGERFTRYELPGEAGMPAPNGWVHDVVATDSGYAAVGGTNDQQQPLAWRSTDLSLWTPAEVGLDDAVDSGGARTGVMWSVAASAAGTLLAGGITSPAAGDRTSWSSIDQGQTWRPAEGGAALVGRWHDAILAAGVGAPLRILRWTDGNELGPAPTPDAEIIDAGRIPTGDDVVVGQPPGDRGGFVVLRDSSGELIALSTRSPTQGCRLALAADVANIDLAPKVVFHDPCHGSNFDRDGTLVAGPGARGMYRYDLAVDRTRVLVDTGFAHPGQPRDRDDVTPAWTTGSSDEVTTRWRDALARAADEVRGDRTHPFFWVLGAFHGSTRDSIIVPFTVDGVIVELSIRSDLDPSDRDAAPDNVTRHELGLGSVQLFQQPRIGPDRAVAAAMDLHDGRHMRVEVPGSLHLGDVLTDDELIDLLDRTTRLEPR